MRLVCKIINQVFNHIHINTSVTGSEVGNSLVVLALP